VKLRVYERKDALRATEVAQAVLAAIEQLDAIGQAIGDEVVGRVR
jgi:hypothetical protein